jgi:hypothetical protein
VVVQAENVAGVSFIGVLAIGGEKGQRIVDA